MLLTLIAAAIAMAPPAPPLAQITISPSSGPADGWHEVSYQLPTDGVASLILRDMTNRSAHCPPVEYAIETVSGATTIEGAGAPPRAIIFLEPDGSPFITVRFSVRMMQPEGGLSVAAAAGCDLLLDRGESAFLYAQALLPAPRAFDANGDLFFFGETRLGVDGYADGPILSTLGAPNPDGHWRLSHFDEARFSFFVLSPAASSAGPGAYTHIPLDAGSARHLGIAAIARRVADRLAVMFDAPAPETYLMVTIQADGADVGDVTGTARPSGQHLVTGSAASSRNLAVLAAHEMAHHWDLSRFRRLEPLAELEWMREGLAEYLAHAALTESGDIAGAEMVRRANRALSNLALGHTPQITAYDEGYLVWFALNQAASGAGRFNGFLRALIAPNDAPLTEAGFWSAVEAAGLRPPGAGDFRAEYGLPCAVEAGETRFTLMRAAWPSYDTGFTRDPQDGGRVAQIAPDGPADRAGLRESDRIERFLGGAYGSVLEPMALRLSDERTVEIWPHGPPGSRYLQYVDENSEAGRWGAEPASTCRG